MAVTRLIFLSIKAGVFLSWRIWNSLKICFICHNHCTSIHLMPNKDPCKKTCAEFWSNLAIISGGAWMNFTRVFFRGGGVVTYSSITFVWLSSVFDVGDNPFQSLVKPIKNQDIKKDPKLLHKESVHLH